MSTNGMFKKSVRTWYAVRSLTNGKKAPRKNLQMHNFGH
jgi:hypothetical protein